MFTGLILWAASYTSGETKLTVQQLDTLLAQMHGQSKSDGYVANKLKETELIEQLLPAVMNSFAQYQPGPETVVQIRVLALESALLAPPPPGSLAPPAPDPATQEAIFNKATDYAARTFAHLPKFDVQKQTLRYQTGYEGVRTENGIGTHMTHSDAGLTPASDYYRYVGEQTVPVTIASGVELPPAKAKAEDPASQTGQTSTGPGPVLNAVLLDVARGKRAWLRWEEIGGSQSAVFSFEVDRKQSQYQVNYCCFPRTENVGNSIGVSGRGVANTSGFTGTATSFEPFRTTPGYEGEIFIDPATGTVMRLVVEAEFKPTDLVQRENTRIDYAARDIAGTSYVVPVHTVIQSTVVVSGNSFSKFETRRVLFESNLSNYQPASGADLPHATIVPPSVQTASQPLKSSRAPQKISEVNAAVVAARAATKDTHFADAEALMLQVTSSRPELVVAWVELGLAQLGLKKYAEAEKSFKMAVGSNPSAPQTARSAEVDQLLFLPGTGRSRGRT